MAESEDGVDDDVSLDGVEKKSKKKLIIIILPVLLLLVGLGLFLEKDKIFSSGTHGGGVKGVKKVNAPHLVMLDVPSMVSNLDSDDGHAVYVKLKVKVEVLASDEKAVQDKIFIVQDVLHTYLHETQREDIKGDGIYRLREAILRRLRVEFAPIDVKNLYFVDFLIQ